MSAVNVLFTMCVIVLPPIRMILLQVFVYPECVYHFSEDCMSFSFEMTLYISVSLRIDNLYEITECVTIAS